LSVKFHDLDRFLFLIWGVMSKYEKNYTIVKNIPRWCFPNHQLKFSLLRHAQQTTYIHFITNSSVVAIRNNRHYQ